jgi:predicted DNA-binding transcriptional regulator AlpA
MCKNDEFREGDRLITLRRVEELTAHRKTWIYQKIREGLLPPGEKIGSRRYWIERLVVEAIRRLLDPGD